VLSISTRHHRGYKSPRHIRHQMKYHFLDEATRLSLLQRVRHRTTDKEYRKFTPVDLDFIESMKYKLSSTSLSSVKLSTKQFEWLLSILERKEKEK